MKPQELGKASQRREEKKGGEGKGSKEWIKLLGKKKEKKEFAILLISYLGGREGPGMSSVTFVPSWKA